jgi:hypothetical protein
MGNLKNIYHWIYLPQSMHIAKGVLKMKTYILVILVLLLIFYTPVQAVDVTKSGTTAAPFLVIDIGPRATGMGSAYVSLANDATAMYWNPAGISRLKNFEATFCNTKWIADLGFNYAGAVLSFGTVGNVGLNATFLSMDQMERTTEFQPEGTGEFFDAGSFAVGLSYARNLTEQFSIGFNVKYINERIYHCKAQGFALDVGALFDTHFQGITLGMCISNYGTKMQLDGQDLVVQHDINPVLSGNNSKINAKLQTDAFDLPLMFRVGLSTDLLKGDYHSNFIISVDALHPSDDKESINVGGEYILYDMFSLRAGYKELFKQDSEQGLTFGAGLRYTISGMNTTVYFDYAYIDFGVFSSVNMFSISLGL